MFIHFTNEKEIINKSLATVTLMINYQVWLKATGIYLIQLIYDAISSQPS